MLGMSRERLELIKDIMTNGATNYETELLAALEEAWAERDALRNERDDIRGNEILLDREVEELRSELESNGSLLARAWAGQDEWKREHEKVLGMLVRLREKVRRND